MAFDSLLPTEDSMKLKGSLDNFENVTPEEDDTKYYDEPVNET